ncbi:O-antigen ligase domain-containing protein, partial [Pseudoalteromonas sp. 78C3]
MNIVKIIKSSLISLFFLCTLIPLIPVISYDYHNHQRITQIAFLLSMSLIGLTSFIGNKEPTFKLALNKKNGILFSVFIFCGYSSALMSAEQSFSLLYTFHISLLIFTM